MNNSQTSNLTVILTLLTIVVAIIGLADASYITYEEYSGVIPVCGQGFDCGKVLSSSWAHIGPVPISVFGMLFYTTMIVLGVLHYLEIPFESTRKQLKRLSDWKLAAISSFSKKSATQLAPHFNAYVAWLSWQKIAFLLSIAGALFTVYLVVLMAFVIKAWCLYCLVSATSSFTLFIIHSILRKITKS